MTILGYVQRGATPSAADRLLAACLGTACAGLIEDGVSDVIVAAQRDKAEPVLLEKAAGMLKTIPLVHDRVQTARRAGTCLGD